jgi:hypothetical protein
LATRRNVIATLKIGIDNLSRHLDLRNRRSQVLTRIGFGPAGGVAGGVLFFDWTLSETEAIQGGHTIDPSDRIEVKGGFSRVFNRP